MDFEEFRLYCLEEGLQAGTVESYIIYLKKITTEIDIFNELQVRGYLAEKRSTLLPGGYNKYPRVLRIFYKFKGFTKFDCVRKLKEKARARILLTDEEIERVINYRPPPDKYGMFFMMLAYTGMRSGEATTLTQADVDLSLGVIYLHKTKTEARTVVVVEPLLSVLKTYLSSLNTELLFPIESNPKKAITYASYMRNWEKRLKGCGIKKKVQPYSCRHSFITNALANGGDLFAVQDIVGHTDSRSTEKYAHRNLDLMKRTASKLPLAVKHQNPRVIADQISQMIDEVMGKDLRFDPIELMEAKKFLYKSIK